MVSNEARLLCLQVTMNKNSRFSETFTIILDILLEAYSE